MLPSLTRRLNPASPLDAVWGMSRELDRVLNDLGRAVETPISGYMPAEVVETDNEMRFEIEVPGLRPEQIDLTMENNVLTVSAERKWEHDEGRPDGEYHLRERRYGRFERSFALPQRLDVNRITATCENGVLTVVLPKVEAAKPRRIEVGVSTGPREIESK